MTTEPIKPPVVTSADNTVLVMFPPDVLESTKPVEGGDCGVSIRIYDLSPMGARVRVDSYLGQEPNDTVALNLNGQPNIASTQTASTDDSVFMYIPKKLLRPEFVNRLTYTVTRLSQNIGTSEPPLEILYNAIRPGIEDRIHGDDGHSELELILPRDVLDDGIDADRAAQGVQVCFSYPYCRAYDKIWLNCNGQDVYRNVTAAEAPAIPSAEPTRICVTVDKAVFERAGDHPQFVFSYTVTDQLGNGPDTDSPWSLSLLVDVYLKTNRLVAPDMAEDPDDPGDDPKTIDLNKLGSKDLTVLVHAFAPLWQPDDIIRVKYGATPTTGAVVEHSVEATVLRIPFTYKLMVPNAKVIAESTVRAKYELIRGGEVIASSRNATARVVGESKIEINAPTLVPPVTSPIDPLAHPSGVQVQVEFSGASPGDEARLVAVNALPGSLPFSMLPLDPDHRAVFTLDAAFLGLWHGKQPQLRWDLIRGGEVIAQSSALVLTINRIAHEDPRLLMPVIVGHTGQMLDVAKLLATDKLSIPQWPLQTKDIPVWLRFDGILADGQSDFRIIWDGQVHKFEPSDLVISLTAAVVNWLKSLKDDSEVRITFAVNFDKVVDGVAAVRFLVRRYSVKALVDMRPEIKLMTDSTGEIHDGGDTLDTDVTFSGEASKGQTIQLIDGELEVGPIVQVNTDGTWSQSIGELAHAEHSFTAKALYGKNQTSEARTFTVNSKFSVDTSDLLLTGSKLSIRGTGLDWLPTGNHPVGTTALRPASGGKRPYTYESGNDQIASVSDGLIISESNGQTTITVEDNLGQSAIINVTVTNVIDLLYNPNSLYQIDALKWINANGRLIPYPMTSTLHLLSVQFARNTNNIQRFITGHYLGTNESYVHIQYANYADPIKRWTEFQINDTPYPQLAIRRS